MSEQKPIQVGERAPDFTLRGSLGSKVTLSDYLGQKNVVLEFHPLAFTSVCTGQMVLLELAHERFDQLDTQVLGLSVDSVPAKDAWAYAIGVRSFPMLADFHPQGEVARKYGLLRPDGRSERAVVVIDKQGIVRFVKVYPIRELPHPEEVLPVLAGL
jgi:peroxiredoxin